MPAAHIVDAPGFPTWDIACPAHDPLRAEQALRALSDHAWVACAEIGPDAFVNLRWHASALASFADRLAVQGAEAPQPPTCRAHGRVRHFLRMAANEHDLTALRAGPIELVETRTLVVRLEAAASTRRTAARMRLLADVARRIDLLWARVALLRGSASEIQERVLAFRAANAVMQRAASVQEGCTLWDAPSPPSPPAPPAPR